MKLENIIGVDTLGGDAVDGVLPEKRIAMAVAETAKKHPDFTFWMVGRDSAVATAYCTMPANVRMSASEPDRKFGFLQALAQMVSDNSIGGFYTLANTQLVMPVVHHDIGIVEELAQAFNGRARPPLLAEIPKSPKVNTVRSWYVLDAGAIPRLTKPEQYLMYAKIGSLYAQHIGQRENPAVGLANIGSEPGKGDDLLRDAYKLLSASGINFAGNVEPYCRTHDFDKGQGGKPRPVDVVVQDGTGGNEYIKVLSDGALLGFEFLEDEIRSGRWFEKWFKMLCALGLSKAFRRTKKRVDPGQYGGAPFLGLNAPVFKGHGTTIERGVVAGLEKYIRFVESNFISRMKEALAKPVVYVK